jgi:hypothetical protein
MSHCNYKCQKTQSPIVQAVEPQRYAVTNVDKITTKCNGLPTEHHLSNAGSLFLSLPCNCKAYHGSTLLIDSVFPCAEQWKELQIEHIVPALFSRNGNIYNYLRANISTTKHDFSKLFVNTSYDLSEVIERVRNITIHGYKGKEVSGIVDIVLNYNFSFEHLIMYAWLGLLTFYMLIPYCKLCFSRSVEIAETGVGEFRRSVRKYQTTAAIVNSQNFQGGSVITLPPNSQNSQPSTSQSHNDVSEGTLYPNPNPETMI